MEDPYTELAGAIIRLREEIVELTGAVLTLTEEVCLLKYEVANNE